MNFRYFLTQAWNPKHDILELRIVPNDPMLNEVTGATWTANDVIAHDDLVAQLEGWLNAGNSLETIIGKSQALAYAVTRDTERYAPV